MDIDKAIQQVLDHYKTPHKDVETSRPDKIFNILSSSGKNLTAAELEEILETIGDPVSRMTVQRAILRLIRDNKVEFKGRVVRSDVTGKKMYVPAYGIK